MNQWWVDDLPLPLPQTTYKWARDHTMLVTLFSKYLQMVGKSFEPPQCKCYKGRNKLNSSRTSWLCQQQWLWTIVARRSVFETTSSRASTSPVLTTGALFFSFLFSTVCILLITRKHRTDNLSSLQLVLATDLKLETFRDLVARPEEAWASLASYCGLDPNNVKPLEAHKKWALLQNFQGSLPMKLSTISWMRFQILILENETILLQGFSARCFPQPRGSSTRGQGGPGVAARSWQVGFFSFQR